MRRLLGQTLLAANSLKPRNVIKWCRYSLRAWMGKEKYCSFQSVELLLLGISCGIWRMLITPAPFFWVFFLYFPFSPWATLYVHRHHQIYQSITQSTYVLSFTIIHFCSFNIFPRWNSPFHISTAWRPSESLGFFFFALLCKVIFFSFLCIHLYFFWQVKRNISDLTNIPVRHQQWEGWPASASDDSVSSSPTRKHNSNRFIDF